LEGDRSLFKGAGANILRAVAGVGALAGYDKLQKVVGECGERSGVYWWRRVEKVMVERRRYGGVIVVENVE
nr:ADP,ATP carrier protein 1, mitochondrial-like [Tanacetum cinerariifolium]